VNWSNEFVVLDKELHDRASFDCGEAELNEFIQQRAAKHMEIGISTTLILPASEPLPNGKSSICAYFTVTPGSVAKATLPISQGKKLPNYPVPVFLIAQLAVHNELKGRGLGKITLVKALEYLWNISKHMKAYAVIVDCLNPGVVKFYEQYDFQPLCIVNGKTRMFLPMTTVGLLFK
jgi:GNAT superfamily N-acetyltransferase